MHAITARLPEELALDDLVAALKAKPDTRPIAHLAQIVEATFRSIRGNPTAIEKQLVAFAEQYPETITIWSPSARMYPYKVFLFDDGSVYELRGSRIFLWRF